MWLLILADIAEQVQTQGANQTYDKPVNWWLAWIAIGLAAFAATVVTWIFIQLNKQDKQLDTVREKEVGFLRETVMDKIDGVKTTIVEKIDILEDKITETKAEVVQIKELVLRGTSRNRGSST